MWGDIKMNFNVTVWNHGLAGNPSVPCDEVDIADIRSDETISFDVIEELMNVTNHNLSTVYKDPFVELPTEKWLDVEVNVTFEDDGFEFHIVGYEDTYNEEELKKIESDFKASQNKLFGVK